MTCIAVLAGIKIRFGQVYNNTTGTVFITVLQASQDLFGFSDVEESAVDS